MILRITLLSASCLLIAALCLLLWPEPSITHAPGILCPDEPVQENLEEAESFRHEDFTITPLAAYEIRALVLSRKEYSDKAAEISPLDLALGWGAMSNQAVIDNLDISQTNRFYLWKTKRLPISVSEISVSSANVHVIPADEDIENLLDGIVRGSVVTMSGCLVQVARSDGFRWRSSLRRDDTGNGACEILYVENLSVE